MKKVKRKKREEEEEEDEEGEGRKKSRRKRRKAPCNLTHIMAHIENCFLTRNKLF